MRNDAKQNGMVASREKCLLSMFLRILLSTFLIVYRKMSGRSSSSSSSRRLDATQSQRDGDDDDAMISRNARACELVL